MERSMGLEPTPGPWQGPVLPLYYDRPDTSKLYHDTLAAVGVNTSKFLPVFIKNGNLPMLMLAAPVLAQLGPFSFFQCCYLRPILSQLKRARTSTDSSNNVRATGKRQEIGSSRQML